MPSHSTANRIHGTVLFVSIALFIEIALFFANIHFSKQISEGWVTANLAGQQLQTMDQLRNTLQSIAPEETSSKARDRISRGLQASLSNIDQTLAAMEKGGTLRGTLGNPIEIPAIASQNSIDALTDTQKQWNPTKEAAVHILFALNNPGSLNNTFTGTQRRVLESTSALYSSIRSLTESLENDIKQQAAFASTLSYTGIALGIFTIGILAFYFSPQLRNADEEQTSEENRLKQLFRNLNEAVVVVDRQQRVAGEYSKRASNLFATEQITGKHLYELLRPLLAPDDINRINQQIASLFNATNLETLNGTPESLNKLTVPTLNTIDSSDELTLHFRTLSLDNKASRVLVSLLPSTPAIIKTISHSEPRLDLTELVSSLSTLSLENPAYLKNFVADAESSISSIYRVISNLLNQTDTPHHSLEAIGKVVSEELTRLKNISTTIHFDTFAQPIESLEEVLKELSDDSDISEFNFQPALSSLDKLSTLTQLINLYTEKESPSQKPLFEHLKPYANDIASQENKQVTTVLTGLNEHSLPPETQSTIDTVSKQFIRHSLIHSIESPETRLSNNKPPVARIDVTLNRLNEGELELNVRDDGAGIDFEKIKETALQRDIAPSSQLKHWSNRKLFNLTLLPNFWSSFDQEEKNEEETQYRMEEVLHQIKDSGGDIQVSTRPGRYTLFQITLRSPVSADTQQSQLKSTRSTAS